MGNEYSSQKTVGHNKLNTKLDVHKRSNTSKHLQMIKLDDITRDKKMNLSKIPNHTLRTLAPSTLLNYKRR